MGFLIEVKEIFKSHLIGFSAKCVHSNWQLIGTTFPRQNGAQSSFRMIHMLRLPQRYKSELGRVAVEGDGRGGVSCVGGDPG